MYIYYLLCIISAIYVVIKNKIMTSSYSRLLFLFASLICIITIYCKYEHKYSEFIFDESNDEYQL